MELFVPSFEGERKRSTRPAMRVLTAGTARAYIHDLLPPRPLSGRPVTPDTPFILLILGGLIYVQQVGDIVPAQLENAPNFFTSDQVFFQQSAVEDNTNWKLITETLLEGHHIKSLHAQTFYPFGFDNINLVELFGANARIIFPFKRIEKLRSVAPRERKIDGMVTSVYHLFPNVSVALLSKHTSVTIMEPLSPSRTRLVSYFVMNPSTDEYPITLEAAKRDVEFVNNSGQEEDRATACAIQETVNTSANSHLTFGYFEKAIVHFHQQLAHHLN